jgi:hypothetical protein
MLGKGCNAAKEHQHTEEYSYYVFHNMAFYLIVSRAPFSHLNPF